MKALELTPSLTKTEEQKSLVAEFVRKRYGPRYKTEPPLADMYAFVAWEGKVLASTGLEFAKGDGSFQIERTYRIDRKSLGIPISPNNTVQIVRWASIDPYAGMLSAWGAVTYAIELDMCYAYAEHDDVVHRRCEHGLGIEFGRIPSASLDLSAVPEAYREYYAGAPMKPYTVNLEQMQRTLVARMKTFLKTH